MGCVERWEEEGEGVEGRKGRERELGEGVGREWSGGCVLLWWEVWWCVGLDGWGDQRGRAAFSLQFGFGAARLSLGGCARGIAGELATGTRHQHHPRSAFLSCFGGLLLLLLFARLFYVLMGCFVTVSVAMAEEGHFWLVAGLFLFCFGVVSKESSDLHVARQSLVHILLGDE